MEGVNTLKQIYYFTNFCDKNPTELLMVIVYSPLVR